ncbi:MAG: hypothetical protein N2510_08655 [Ignavibacteria bacterium]|nr:hypothetical protein [Ignavibacteria bacterium]
MKSFVILIAAALCARCNGNATGPEYTVFDELFFKKTTILSVI